MSDQFNTNMKPVSLEVTMMKRIGELKAENARLKAEVERLTKAGDLLAVHYTALSKCVTPNNAKSGSINNWTSVIEWNAAKEGKQFK